jgi:hypothetical protein
LLRATLSYRTVLLVKVVIVASFDIAYASPCSFLLMFFSFLYYLTKTAFQDLWRSASTPFFARGSRIAVTKSLNSTRMLIFRSGNDPQNPEDSSA